MRSNKPEETAASPERLSGSRPVRFIGSFNHNLDSKGRLVIPQSFRDKLGEKFCIAPSYDFQSVALYPNEKWEERNETYEKLGDHRRERSCAGGGHLLERRSLEALYRRTAGTA